MGEVRGHCSPGKPGSPVSAEVLSPYPKHEFGSVLLRRRAHINIVNTIVPYWSNNYIMNPGAPYFSARKLSTQKPFKVLPLIQYSFSIRSLLEIMIDMAVKKVDV